MCIGQSLEGTSLTKKYHHVIKRTDYRIKESRRHRMNSLANSFFTSNYFYMLLEGNNELNNSSDDNSDNYSSAQVIANINAVSEQSSDPG